MNLWKSVKAVLVLAVTLVMTSGCAVLTKSQVAEVNAFAKAASDYGTLPGEPIRYYAEVNRLNRLVNISAREFSDRDAREEAWSEAEAANSIPGEFRKVADQVDITLEVYESYAELLQAVCSNEYTDSLHESAKALGQKVDKATDRFNALVRAPAGKGNLKGVGGMVAAVVRAGGGFYIRWQQARILRNAVLEAHPVLIDMTDDVRVLVDTKVKPELDRLERQLGQDFKTAAGRAKQLPLETVVAVADGRAKLDAARKLCDAAVAASQQFAVAHGKLAENVSHRRTLKERIAEIRVLADEIKKAQKVKKEVGK